MATIRASIETKRGCGYRKEGGLYMVTDGVGRSCGRLPVKLTVCPCCNQGIKPARGWTWINGYELIKSKPCTFSLSSCVTCPLSATNLPQMDKVGLIWIGETFYKKPIDWIGEATRMGVSRRIKTVPRGFELGKTWVFVAHRKVFSHVEDGVETWEAGIFQIFKPARIEYVVKETDSEEMLNKLEERGISLVHVIRDVDEPEFSLN